MKNLCFFNSADFWGGGEKLHLENAIEFRKLGYQVTIASKFNSPLWHKAKENQIDTFAISVHNLSFLNPLKIFRLYWFYKSNKIDTIFFSISEDTKLGAFSAYLSGVKRIVYLRGLAVPIKYNFVNRILFQSILTHLIPNSDETKKTMLQNLGNYVNHKKVKTIYHGIEINDNQLNSEDKLKIIQEKSHGIVLGNAGRLTKQKGQDNLIEIAKKLADKNIDFTLFIAGEGELKNELELLIKKYKLEQNVILLGHVNEMEKFMQSIDVFLLTSIWEGFGFVLVEAMAKSKPIVAFDITSNPEIVENEKNGYLVQYPDLDEFVEKILVLISDKTLRDSMGSEGYKVLVKKFILKDRIKEIETFLVKN